MFANKYWYVTCTNIYIYIRFKNIFDNNRKKIKLITHFNILDYSY